jgi:hypothetical protein
MDMLKRRISWLKRKEGFAKSEIPYIDMPKNAFVLNYDLLD